VDTDEYLDDQLALYSGWITDSNSPDAHEIVGRIRRHRGESGWQDHFRSAIEGYLARPRNPDNLSAANLSRILGEHEAARGYWQGAIDHAESHRSMGSPEKTRVLISRYFLRSDGFESHAHAMNKAITKQWPLLDLWIAESASEIDGLQTQLGVWQRKAKRVTIATNRDSPSPHDMVEHIEGLIATFSA